MKRLHVSILLLCLWGCSYAFAALPVPNLFPTAVPTAPVLVLPADGAVDYDDGFFYWTLSTDDGGAGVVYDFYLGTDPNSIPLYQAGLYNGFADDHLFAYEDSGMLVMALFQGLPAQSTLYWYVVARSDDGTTAASNVQQFTTSNNNYTLPGKPLNPTPATAAADVTVVPTLQWDESTDPDGDVVTYQLYLDTSRPPQQLRAVSLPTPTLTISEALQGNTTYYWQVVADDGRGGTTEGDIWTFTTQNLPPAAATLQAPAHQATDVPFQTTFSWLPAVDADGNGAAVTYQLWYGTTPQPEYHIVTQATSVPLSLQSNTAYYWYVEATDAQGGQSVSLTRSFTTVASAGNQAPAVPVLLAPAHQATGVGTPLTLQWQAATDADADAVAYEIYIGLDAAALARVATTALTQWQATGLDAATTYYWQVLAYDAHGGTTPSQVFQFTTTADDVGMEALQVYYRYPGTVVYQFSQASLTPDFAANTVAYRAVGRTTMTDAAAVALYYDDPTTQVTFTLPEGFTASTNISYPYGLPTDAAALYLIEGTFDTHTEVTVHLQAGSAVRTYTLDLGVNQLPAVPVLNTPAHGTQAVPVKPTFTWQAAADPDGGSIIYRVYAGTTETALLPIGFVANAYTVTATSALLNAVKYYWKVVALDQQGESRESSVFSFVTERQGSRALTAPVLQYPRTISTYQETNFELVWQYDDTRQATYDVYLDTQNPPARIAQDVNDVRYAVQGLAHETTYYWQVVARHPDGMTSTASPVQSFITKPAGGAPTGAFTDARDGQVYQWVSVGNQQWMVHNLAYEPTPQDGFQGYSYYVSTLTDGKEYFMLNNQDSNLRQYGYLYNWYGAQDTVVNTQVPIRGVCPEGWHIPDYDTWRAAIPSLDPALAGLPAGTVYYGSWNIAGHENEWLNASGFSMLPGGFRYSYGVIVDSDAGQWWLADATTPQGIRYFYDPTEGRLKAYWREEGYSTAASIRCVKDTNQPPTTPVLTSPANEATHQAFASLAFTWQPSTDADADAITYTVYLDTAAAPARIVATDLTEPSVTIDLLTANTGYYWKVVATDAYGYATESAVHYFTTQAGPANQAPAAAALLTPANEAAAVAQPAVLTWAAVTDADGDAVTYDVWMASASGPLTRVAAALNTTTFTLPVVPSGTVVTWQVTVHDEKGGAAASALQTFTTFNTPPAQPVLVAPANHLTGMIYQYLTWQPATDADGDAVQYHVYRGTNPNALTQVATGLRDPQFATSASPQNTTYYWQVVADDGQGGTTASDVWQYTVYDYIGSTVTTLTAPLNAATGVDLNPTLTWNAYPSTLYFYDVYLGDPATPPVQVAHDLPSTTTAFTVDAWQNNTHLEPHTTYAWKVVVKNAAGAIKETSTWTFTTRNSLPTLPTLVAPAAAATNQAYTPTLQWTASTDADADAVAYDVYLAESPDPQTLLAEGVTATTYTVPAFTLTPNTTYYWKVIAKDRFGAQTASAIQSFTTGQAGNTAPAPPVLLTPVAYSGGLQAPVSFTWEPSVDIDADAVVYDFYLDTSGAFTTPIQGGFGTPFTSYANLLPHTTYYWQVVARDGQGGEAASAVWNFTTTNAAPAAVNLLSPAAASQLTTPTATLAWEPVLDPNGDAVVYDVYLGTDPQAATRVAVNLTGTAFDTGTLANNTLYYWRVVAKDAYEGETSSAIRTFYGQNVSPSAPILQSPAQAGVVTQAQPALTWLPVTDPDDDVIGYQIFLDTNPTPGTSLGVVYHTTAFITPVLTEGVPYYWQVVARDAHGGITESEVHTFTYQSDAANQPPAAPVLLTPADGSTFTEADITLTWTAAADPDGDAVTYDVYMAQAAAADVLVAAGLVNTTFTYTNVPAGTYYWKVVAKDADHASASTIWRFAKEIYYTLSGTVHDAAGNPLASVLIAGLPVATYTDAQGAYTYVLPAGWSGTLTPQLTGYTFEPTSRTVPAVQANVTAQDFTGTLITYTVSGRITNILGWPFAGVALTGLPQAVSTNAQGYYTATVPFGWTGTVVPVLEHFSFFPASRPYTNVQADQDNQYYLGWRSGHRIIAGIIVDSDQQPTAGVLLQGIDDTPLETDADGLYYVEVPEGWSGEITPVFSSLHFDPESRQYEIVEDDLIDEDYRAAAITGLPPGAETMVQASPNPTTGAVRITFQHLGVSVVSLIISNNQGQTMAQYTVTPGMEEVIWPGTNAEGQPVSAGMYFYRLYDADANLIKAGKIVVE